MRALLTSRMFVTDALIDMKLSLRGVLRNFGLKLGQVSSRGAFRPARRHQLDSHMGAW